MNNFRKIYTAQTLKKNNVVTIVSLPMEESIMVPVSQMIDLMKQGENILFFSFTHDSIKINNFLQPALKNEENPESITGNIAIIDVHQIPLRVDWIKFIEDTIDQVKNQCNLSYVFFDIIPFVKNHSTRPGDDDLVISTATLLSFTKKITSIVLKTIDIPIITATQNSDKSKEIMDEFMSKDLMISLKSSIEVVNKSDIIIGIQRKGNNFWKKVINFLLFWRKKNNFTIKILKNRNGNNKSYKTNVDMDTFKVDVL